MKLIGLISDTHGFLDSRFETHLKKCDEIWHAGDIGDIKIIDQLKEISIVRAVFGNIDNHIIRSEFNEDVIEKYLKKEINLNQKKFDNSLLKEPFFLNK